MVSCNKISLLCQCAILKVGFMLHLKLHSTAEFNDIVLNRLYSQTLHPNFASIHPIVRVTMLN